MIRSLIRLRWQPSGWFGWYVDRSGNRAAN